jgi:hypothetical protein
MPRYPTDPGEVEINTLALTQPVWQYGLCNADWLFGQKPQEANTVGFFVLSKIDDDATPSESQREDDLDVVLFLCILPKQPTTGAIMPPVVMSRSPRASGRLSQPIRLMVMGCSTLCRQK